MTLGQLYREMRVALQSHVDAATLDRLTTEAARYAGTVGWAEGIIDKDGRIVAAFDGLREVAKASYERGRDSNIATLHDALADLVFAIRSHDQDLDPSFDSDEHDI